MAGSPNLQASSMGAKGQKKNPAQTLLAGRPNTSSPELPTSTLPDLLEFDARPRSWSAQDNSPQHRASCSLVHRGITHSSGCYSSQPSSPAAGAPGVPGASPQGIKARGTVGSLRAASIRSSSARASSILVDSGLDRLAAQSAPSVAATFAADAYPVEARGQMVGRNHITLSRAELPAPAQASPSKSPRHLHRNQALHTMRLLAAGPAIGDSRGDLASLPDDTASSSTTTTAINAVSGGRTSSRASSHSFGQPGDRGKDQSASQPTDIAMETTAPPLLPGKAQSIRHSPKLEPVAKPATPEETLESVDVCVMTAANESDAATAPSSPTAAQDSGHSLWSALSRLTLRTHSAPAHSSPGGGPEMRKSAIERLKYIESKQHAHKSNADGNGATVNGAARMTSQNVSAADERVQDAVSTAEGTAVLTHTPTSNTEPSGSSSSSNNNSNGSYWAFGWWSGRESQIVEKPVGAQPGDAQSEDVQSAEETTEEMSVEPAEEEAAVPVATVGDSSGESKSQTNGELPGERSLDAAQHNASHETEALAAPNQPETQPSQDVASGSGWLWGWLGTSTKLEEPSRLRDSDVQSVVVPASGRPSEPHTAHALSSGMGKPGASADPAATASSQTIKQLYEHAADSGPTDSTASQGSSSTESLLSSPGHNAQLQQNMLLPRFDFDACAAPVSLGGARANTPPCTSKRKLSATSTGTAAGDEMQGSGSDDSISQADEPRQPLQKRLRLLGRSVLDSVIEIAPEWARAIVEGQKLADRLGQIDGGSSHNGCSGPTPEQIRDSMNREAKQLGKTAVIGIHGWFPTKMLQMVAGEPTGKSEKFCLMMRDALKSYLWESHGVSASDQDISLFPLVGEGKIEDRVDLLLSQIIDAEPPGIEQPDSEPAASEKGKEKAKAKGGSSDSGRSKSQSEIAAEALMPERKRRAEVLRAADTVFVVTHSQGTPVSALLLERLMEMGLVDTSRQRVGMLAMAGISHGPLPYLRDNVVIRYIESEAARELFELMDPSSPQSQRYVAALSTVLHKGVRLVCIGSWVDEVVPLYSAILQGVSHPNVYRAVYIDAPHYLDDFLTNLIVFALRLRNMGIYDHDLLIHLSEVVAGSLWGHSGHSTVYGEPDVFKLMIKWLLYSTSSVSTSMPGTSSRISVGRHTRNASGSQIHMSYRPFNASERLNPFYIPWIMRTLWDEPEIRQNSDLRAELKRLVALFDKWKPETKAGKELKYRLEPVRAAM